MKQSEIKPFILLAALFAAVLCFTASCSGIESSRALLDDAETAYSSGNYEEAQAICDTLATRIANGGDNPGAVASCRVAAMLMRLSEHSSDSDENMALALKAMKGAQDCGPDSLAAALRALPLEDQAVLLVLGAINIHSDSAAMNAPADFPDEFSALEAELDSLELR